MPKSRKVWLWVSVIVSLTGLQNIFFPATTMPPFGLELTGTGLELLRFVGVLQISIGVLFYSALKLTSADARRAIDLFGVVGYGLGMLFAIYQALNGGGATVWAQVPVGMALTAAFGYYYFGGGAEPAPVASQRKTAR